MKRNAEPANDPVLAIEFLDTVSLPESPEWRIHVRGRRLNYVLSTTAQISLGPVVFQNYLGNTRESAIAFNAVDAEK
jgi:hypothetical protein